MEINENWFEILSCSYIILKKGLEVALKRENKKEQWRPKNANGDQKMQTEDEKCKRRPKYANGEQNMQMENKICKRRTKCANGGQFFINGDRK